MQSQLELFAQSFENELALRGAILDLLAKMPQVSGVDPTHGVLEHGKDIVFTTSAGLDERILCACVVKNTKISGAVGKDSGAMTVLQQARQALKNPYINSLGERQRIARVYVMTPHEVSQIALSSIQGELQESAGQIKFLCGGELLQLFENHYSEYLLLKSGLLTSYVSTLRQAFEDSGPLHHISLKHGVLGLAKRRTARAYVEPEFQLSFRQIEGLRINIPGLNRLRQTITANQLDDLKLGIAGLLRFVEDFSDEACSIFTSSVIVKNIQVELAESLQSLDEAWELSFSANLDRRQTRRSVHERQLVGLELKAGPLAQARISSALERTQQIVNEISRIGGKACIDCAGSDSGLSALSSACIQSYSVSSELGRSWPQFLRLGKYLKVFDLSESLLGDFGGSLLISGPPGYGKTSFCKWSALHDGERFAKGDSDILPIYVALHRFADTAPLSFDDSFLKEDQLPDVVRTGRSKHPGARIRLYLDGLDEVPPERQHALLRIASEGIEATRNLQIVVTARDHVSGPWISWLPRVQISALSNAKVRDLVCQLLDHEASRISEFFLQLKSVPALAQLLKVPLLCTLTVSVFLGAMSLPESKSELYRIFVDLLCGGWDIAKGIKRRSQFNAPEKLRVLIHLAYTLHFRRARSILGDGIRKIFKETRFIHIGSWETLINDIVQDGLLTRDGPSYAFSHLSFQEYLCARYVADFSTERQIPNQVFQDFLAGDDWWRDVATFYIGLSNRPDRVLAMVNALLPGDASSLARLEFLKLNVKEMFPPIKPK